MCQLDWDESASVWHDEERTARKEHACDCCGGLIRVGTRYVRNFTVFDGHACNEKTCTPCIAMTATFREVHGTAGTPSSMRPLLDECIAAETEEGNRAMAAKWKAELRKMDARRETRERAGEGT